MPRVVHASNVTAREKDTREEMAKLSETQGGRLEEEISDQENRPDVPVGHSDESQRLVDAAESRLEEDEDGIEDRRVSLMDDGMRFDFKYFQEQIKKDCRGLFNGLLGALVERDDAIEVVHELRKSDRDNRTKIQNLTKDKEGLEKDLLQPELGKGIPGGLRRVLWVIPYPGVKWAAGYPRGKADSGYTRTFSCQARLTLLSQ